MNRPALDPTSPARPGALLRGGLWVTASVLVPNVYLVVMSVATARYLGPAGLGRQSLIAFASVSATTLAGTGGFLAIVRSVAAAIADEDRASARALALWGLRLQLATGCVGGVLVGAPALWGAQPVAWILAGLVTLLGTLQMAPMAVLVGAQRWRDANAIGLLTGALAVPATLTVLHAGGGIEGLFAVEAAVVAANVLFTSALSRRALAEPDRDPRKTTTHRIDTSVPLRFAALSTLGVAVTVVVWRRSELAVLAWLSTEEEIARYSVAFTASAVLLTLSERFATTMTPVFTSLVSGGDRAGLQAASARAARILLVATLPLAGCAAGLGPSAIRVLYGDAYARSGAVLLVLLTTMAVLPIWSVSTAILAAHGDAASPLIAGGAGAAVNVALSLWLIARHGALGAAATNVAGQVTATVLMYRLARRRSGPMAWDIDSVLRSLLVTTGAGAATFCVTTMVAGPLGLISGIGTGACALVVLARWTRPLTAADASWIARSLGGRLGDRSGVLLSWAARRGSSS